MHVADDRRSALPVRRIDRVARCASCGAEIYWSTTAAGAHMPLSAATVQADSTGQLTALPHWIDCPSRDAHRRARPTRTAAATVEATHTQEPLL